jgi:hypothetical protein
VARAGRTGTRMTTGALGRTVAAAALLAGCQTTGLNPTGLHGTEVRCPEGPRQTLDCRGAIQQYARDFRADVAYMQTVAVGFGYLSNKLIEADAITTDLVQHYYQTCTLYNACLITRQEYVAKTERLQEIQLSVRQALAAAGFGAQQNIQINPLGAGVPPGGVPVGPGGVVMGGAPPPGGSGGPAVAAGGPTPAADAVESILNILREGSRLVQQPGGPQSLGPAPGPAVAAGPVPAPGGPPALAPGGAPSPDLDGALRTALAALKQGVVRQSPSLQTARAAVGPFTEEGQPWTGPLGALLQEQVARLVESGYAFSPAAASPVRGIAVRQAAGVANPNDPAALGQLFGGDLAIVGSYRQEGSGVTVRMRAVDGQGRELAQQVAAISQRAIPGAFAGSPTNAVATSQLLGSLGQLGARSTGPARVDLTTNKPGTGASFRIGEEIRYLVTPTIGGYLYLFHVDAERRMLRIFPNDYHRDARVDAGTPVEVPTPGSPFKFEAAPPFGLETTFAIVTPVPLDERDFRAVEGGFARPGQDVPQLLATRGIRVSPASGPAGAPPPGPPGPGPAGSGPAGTTVVWNHVTVLIRP